MAIDLEGRVAIVTGAGNGLGREHALLLAKRGAKLVINDFGGARDGSGGSLTPAEAVVEEIEFLGGTAMANGADVSDFEQVEDMVLQASKRWGRVDILVNNAGILRDKTFAKASLEDFCAVFDVHLWGSVHCAKAVWNMMRVQNYGRIIFTTSSSGLFGNFGQSSYGAAKMAVVGLMNTLSQEGAKNDIRVNCLAPSATTRMTSQVFDEEASRLLNPAAVSAAVLVLASENAPNKAIICGGAGSFELANIGLSNGKYIGTDEHAAEKIQQNWDAIADFEGAQVPSMGWDQIKREIALANEAQS